MDCQHRGALPHTAGQTGETIQVHRDLCCDAENWSRTPHCQFLLLGHGCGRKLHSEMGKPHHVLCGQCVCCGYCIGHKHILAQLYTTTIRRAMQCVPVTSRGARGATIHNHTDVCLPCSLMTEKE